MHDALGTTLYLYTCGPQSDGFLKKNFSDYTQGLKESKLLDNTYFNSLMNRRVAGSDNTIMVNHKGFWRKVVVRHPKDGLSTPETRAEGLAILKKCFLSKEFTQFPPDDIETIDATDVNNPKAMDMFLQDHDIIDIMKEQICDDDLNEEFYGKYNDCAMKIWSGTNYPAYARSLGFP